MVLIHICVICSAKDYRSKIQDSFFPFCDNSDYGVCISFLVSYMLELGKFHLMFYVVFFKKKKKKQTVLCCIFSFCLV